MAAAARILALVSGNLRAGGCATSDEAVSGSEPDDDDDGDDEPGPNWRTKSSTSKLVTEAPLSEALLSAVEADDAVLELAVDMFAVVGGRWGGRCCCIIWGRKV